MCSLAQYYKCFWDVSSYISSLLVKIQPHITSSHCLASTTPEPAVVQEIMIKVSSLLRRLVLLSTALLHFLDLVFQDKIVIDEKFWSSLLKIFLWQISTRIALQVWLRLVFLLIETTQQSAVFSKKNTVLCQDITTRLDTKQTPSCGGTDRSDSSTSQTTSTFLYHQTPIFSHSWVQCPQEYQQLFSSWPCPIMLLNPTLNSLWDSRIRIGQVAITHKSSWWCLP